MEIGDFFAGWFALLVLLLPFALFITIAAAWVAVIVAAVTPMVAAPAASGSLQEG